MACPEEEKQATKADQGHDAARVDVEPGREEYAIFSDLCARRRKRWPKDREQQGDGAITAFLNIAKQSLPLSITIQEQGIDPVLSALAVLPLVPTGAAAVFRRISWVAIGAWMAADALPPERIEELRVLDLDTCTRSAPPDIEGVERWVRLVSRGAPNVKPLAAQQSHEVWTWLFLRHRAVARVFRLHKPYFTRLLHRVYAADVVLTHSMDAIRCMLELWKCTFAHQETVISYAIREVMNPRDDEDEFDLKSWSALLLREHALAVEVEGRPAGHWPVLLQPPKEWQPMEEDAAKVPTAAWTGTPLAMLTTHTSREHLPHARAEDLMEDAVSAPGAGLTLTMPGSHRPVWRLLTDTWELSHIHDTVCEFLMRRQDADELTGLLEHPVFGATLRNHPCVLRTFLTTHAGFLGMGVLRGIMADLQWSNNGIATLHDLGEPNAAGVDPVGILREFGFCGKFVEGDGDSMLHLPELFEAHEVNAMKKHADIIPWWCVYNWTSEVMRERELVAHIWEHARSKRMLQHFVDSARGMRGCMEVLMETILARRPLEELGVPMHITKDGMSLRVRYNVEFVAILSECTIPLPKWKAWVEKDVEHTKEWGYRFTEPLGVLRSFQSRSAEHLVMLWSKEPRRHAVCATALLQGGWQPPLFAACAHVLRQDDMQHAGGICNVLKRMDPQLLTDDHKRVLQWYASTLAN